MSVYVMLAERIQKKNQYVALDRRIAVFTSQAAAEDWRKELEIIGYVVTCHARNVQGA